MAQDAQVVLVAGSAPAPEAYTVPPAQEIMPRTAYATFDGTSASADFYPCVQFVSDAGIVFAQALTDSIVTAGNAVEVSFYPLARSAAANTNIISGGAAGLSDEQMGLIQQTVSINQVNNSGQFVDNGGARRVYCCLLPYLMEKGTTITGLVVNKNSSNVTAMSAAGVFQLGLVDPATLRVVAISADQKAHLFNTNPIPPNFIVAPFQSAYVSTGAPLYAMMFKNCFPTAGTVTFPDVTGQTITLVTGGAFVPPRAGFSVPRFDYTDNTALPSGAMAVGTTLNPTAGTVTALSGGLLWWLAAY